MNYEIEYDSRISQKAILLTILFHLILLALSVVIEIRNSVTYSNNFVSINFTETESIIPDEKNEPEEIPLPEKVEQVQPLELEKNEEITPLKIQEPVTASSNEASFVIDESFNTLLDSVLLANPTLYGLKTIVKERMQQNAERDKVKPTPIEAAREKLKIQLIALYKDRYGDISPDKYAAQLNQNGYGVGIPIPLGPIIDLLKDLF